MLYKSTVIDQLQYIKFQPKAIDFCTRLWGNNYKVCGVYSPKSHAEVYCFKLNFNISKLVYSSFTMLCMCPSFVGIFSQPVYAIR